MSIEVTEESLSLQAKEATKLARNAVTAWAKLDPKERATRLRAAADDLLVQADDLAELVHRETGKPLAEAFGAEVVGLADVFAYWCRTGPALLKPRKGQIPRLEMPGKSARIERLPRGVVAIIAPWNFPIAIPIRNIVPALLAGNAVILKPSEASPQSGRWLVEKLRASLGDVVGLVEGDGRAGAALVEANPDMVVFTGSTATGRKVAAVCAQRGIVFEGEFGGKDCAVVLEDADLERAAAGIAWATLHNAGQNCAAVERIAVSATIAQPFTEALIQEMKRAGDDVHELVTAQQKRLVIEHIEDAQAHGATVLTGGVPEGDAPIPPTLLTNVPRTARAWAEESFGPIAVLEVCDQEDDLIEAANDSIYGLGTSVWSRDVDRAERIGAQIHSGMLWINNHSFTGAVPDLPWVGVGASGTGLTNSPEALLAMTRPKLVMVDKYPKREPWWYPYGTSMIGLMRAVIDRQRNGGLAATLRTLKALKVRNHKLKS